MTASARSPLAWLLIVTLLLVPTAGFADPEHKEKEAQLQALRKKMDALRSRLSLAEGSRRELEEQLRTSEVNIGRLATDLRDIQHRLREQEVTLRTLQKENQTLARDMNVQRRLLARQVHAAYVMGRQGQLKVLLNQEDPSTLERMLTYYGYFSRSRAEQIGLAKVRLARLQDLETTIREQTLALQRLRAQKVARKAEHEAQRQTRERVLAELRREIQAGDRTLERLSENEKQLEQLLQALREMFADIPGSLDGRRPFAKSKGQLPWPSRGEIRHGFGTSRRRGNLKWQGVVIAAGHGQPVQAIHRGRVAFADWLRGLGLLIIVDHGDGYMSLYGHNQSLLKETGDWVEAGDLLATVGKSGGRSEAGLYFEIRHKGAPVDPGRWCRRG